MTSRIRAVLFDLDGVITDTAEYHYQAWQQLADEEGVPFDRAANEKLRGVSRQESLRLLLAGRTIDDATAAQWLARKNKTYQELLQKLTSADLLPGVAELLAELKLAGIKIAVVSASQNAPTVLRRLEVGSIFDAVVAGPNPADGAGRNRPKPTADLFALAAFMLGVAPGECLVVEDAESGIAGARMAGMATVGLGPQERVGAADLVLDSLEGVGAAQLLHAGAWRLSEGHFNPQRQHHWETVFTIGNGSLGCRGSLEEHFPDDRPATLMHGLWDDTAIVYTELANAFDWTAVDLWIDGVPFNMQHGAIADYVRCLDLRTGELYRRLVWTPKPDTAVELTFTRVANLADPQALGVRVTVTPLTRAVDVRLRARLDGQVENEGLLHWRAWQQGEIDGAVFLSARTRTTGKQLVQAMRVALHGADATPTATDAPRNPAMEVAVQMEPGQTVALDKLVSAVLDRDAADPLSAALEKVRALALSGWDALVEANRSAWATFWQESDIIIEGDDEAQLAVRHGLFQLRIAAPNTDLRASIGARSLSGFGYRGHAFWDTESFMLPFFSFTQPALARNLLMYRWHTLAGARRKAAAGGWRGAQFAWESAETGDEVTPRWVPGPQGEELVRIWCGDIELHITVDVVYGLHQHWRVTGDDAFMAEVGAEIIFETALFWESRVEADRPMVGQYSISDVIGPDEYHDHVTNNAYTNRMVRWHFETAEQVLLWLQRHNTDRAAELIHRYDLSAERRSRWQTISRNLVFHIDPASGLIEQFDGFFRLKEVDWPAVANRTQSMQSLLGIEGANQHQVLKQPDVLFLLCLLRDDFDLRTWLTNWDYYNPRTDHSYGSSLGPAMHAWAACEIGKIDEAYEHFQRAARADIDDVRGNVRDGIHAASCGGLWQALVFGFAGLRVTADGYHLQPRLPAHWRRLAFSFRLRGERQQVDLRAS